MLLLLNIFCRHPKSSCVMLRDFSFFFSATGAGAASVPPAPPSEDFRHQVAPRSWGVQPFRYHGVVERDHVTRLRRNIPVQGRNVQATDAHKNPKWLMRDEVQCDVRTQETVNQQLTPSTRLLQSNASSIRHYLKSRKVIRELSSSRNTQGASPAQHRRRSNNYVTFPIARFGPHSEAVRQGTLTQRG